VISRRWEHQCSGSIGSQNLSPRKSKVADKATAASIPTIRSINTDVASNVPNPPGTIPIPASPVKRVAPPSLLPQTAGRGVYWMAVGPGAQANSCLPVRDRERLRGLTQLVTHAVSGSTTSL
jgi:hypothetical protein